MVTRVASTSAAIRGTVRGMHGPIILVTGATDGIGRETARELTRRGARVLVHGRNPGRVADTVAELRSLGGAPPEPVVADLASLAAVRAMAAELAARGVQPEVLLHNAGVYMKRREHSADGFEMTLAVNHLAPFLLTHLLLASSVGDQLRRIVNVSSMAHNRGRIDLEDVQLLRASFNSYASYASSKLANVLFTVELARRLAQRKVMVNALHPGVSSTKLLTEGFEMEGSDSIEASAATSVMLCVDPGLAQATGGYYVRGKPAPMHAVARDVELGRRFYEVSVGMTGAVPLPG
jgi:NAD(P)-dependent dehydrogenase (short-subunit alcohol dehydrogenase family)